MPECPGSSGLQRREEVQLRRYPDRRRSPQTQGQTRRNSRAKTAAQRRSGKGSWQLSGSDESESTNKLSTQLPRRRRQLNRPDSEEMMDSIVFASSSNCHPFQNEMIRPPATIKEPPARMAGVGGC